MPNIEDAILLAVTLRKGQVDKAGAPYILHPLRVMFRLETEQERITAVLHDIVEDYGVSLDQLREWGYPDEVVEALDFLSKRPEEKDDYEAFIQRVGNGPELARRVKIADLEDNSDLSRFPHPTDRDISYIERCGRAIAVLRDIGPWRLKGLDTLSWEPYELPGEYKTEAEAQDAARQRLELLESTQPASESGGQSEHGIQDHVYVVRPDGTIYRYPW